MSLVWPASIGIELISLEPKPSVKVVWKLAGLCADSATVRSLPLSLPTVTVYSNAERGVPRSDGRRDFRLSLAGVSVPTVRVNTRSGAWVSGPLALSTTFCEPGLASFGTSTRSCRLMSWLMPGMADATDWPPPKMSTFQPAGTSESESATGSGRGPGLVSFPLVGVNSPARTVFEGWAASQDTP